MMLIAGSSYSYWRC